jgi:uncharacterized membrane protein
VEIETGKQKKTLKHKLLSLHEIFRVSVFLKGFFAVLDIVGGTLLYLFGKSELAENIVKVAQGELLSGESGIAERFFWNTVMGMLPNGLSFPVIYLLVHGVISLVFVVGLWRDRSWAYPFAITALSTFLVYQVYRFYHTHSLWLACFIVFEIFFIWLTHHEYRRRGLASAET